MTYDYFYGQQADQFSFYRIPKALFTDDAFDGITTDAKLLYGILLDRMNLSAKNGWLDTEGRVYIIFTLDEVQESLGCGHGKAAKLLDELDGNAGLIERKRQGLGKPNLIYVKNFISGVSKSNFLKSENRTSGSSQIGNQEIPKENGSKTDFKKTDSLDTESYPFHSSEVRQPETKRSETAQRDIYRSVIKENIDFDILSLDRKLPQDILVEIVELMVDVVCSSASYIRVAKDDIVCTHIDKAHIHNHIIWNSTALDCTRKFRNFWGSTAAVRKLSDLICTEHRLSVIENPARHGKSYNKWLGNEYKLSNRDLLRMAIDQAIENSPKDMDELIRFLEEAGYTAKRGKYLSFRPEGQKQFIRLRSLGDGYGEDELIAVLNNEKKHVPYEKKKYPRRQQKTTLVSQLEAKINTGKGFGYDQAMKVIKFKQMAKTMVFAEEKGFDDFAALARAASDAETRFHELRTQIKAAETRMVEIQSLKTHIINYVKTKDAWDGYRKSGYSKKYLAEHEGEIILHRASKKAFDDLGLKKLPTVKSLNEEFAALLAEKKAAYAEYHNAQNEMRELMTHKANAAYILGIDEQSTQRKEYQYE